MGEHMKRTDKDFAIEHAGYMAEAAKHLLECVNAEAAAREAHENSWDLAVEAERAKLLESANEATGEAMQILTNRIYEFEKRRDRAAAPTEATVGTGAAEGLAALEAARTVYELQFRIGVLQTGTANTARWEDGTFSAEEHAEGQRELSEAEDQLGDAEADLAHHLSGADGFPMSASELRAKYVGHVLAPAPTLLQWRYVGSSDWINSSGTDAYAAMRERPDLYDVRELFVRMPQDAAATSYELHGFLVYETKFGGHWEFHPKDELPAGDFLKHREHTPVYTRAGKSAARMASMEEQTA